MPRFAGWIGSTGGASAWSVSHPGGTFHLEGPTPSAEQAQAQAITYPGAQIRGVSCPSIQFCVAVSFQGNFYSSTNPTGGESAWKVVPQAETGPNIHMLGISCPSPSLCVAVAYGGKVLTSTNPSGDSASWAVTQLAEPLDLRGVSCASVSLCVAVDNEGRIVSSTDPRGGPDAWRSAGAPGVAGIASGLPGGGVASGTASASSLARRMSSCTESAGLSDWETKAIGSRST